MRVIKCDACKREIEEPSGLIFEFETEGGKLMVELEDEREMCESCRNRIIRGLVKENFPLER